MRRFSIRLVCKQEQENLVKPSVWLIHEPHSVWCCCSSVVSEPEMFRQLKKRKKRFQFLRLIVFSLNDLLAPAAVNDWAFYLICLCVTELCHLTFGSAGNPKNSFQASFTLQPAAAPCWTPEDSHLNAPLCLNILKGLCLWFISPATDFLHFLYKRNDAK